MRLSAVLSVLFVLMVVTQGVTLSKHGGKAHHASSKHAASKSKHAASKSKAMKAVSQGKKGHKDAPGAAKKSQKDAPGAAKKRSHKTRHTTTLVQAKQHEEDFGTTGGGGEEPQQAGPAPAARPASGGGPAPAARPASGGGTAAAVWSGETTRYGPCLRDFASLVSNNECAQEKLGDVEYFLNTVNQEEHTLSAGYKTGMARKGMVIEGIGMNASSSEATPLTRHAFQRSRVELAYACAPAGSECKSYMTPVNEIDSSIGKDKECPTKLMQGGTHPAMRGRFVQIVHAYSTNSDAYFWANSRQYAAAVAVCFHIRTYGEGGSQTVPPGMLLKENIYDPAPAGVVVDLEEEGGGDVAIAPGSGGGSDPPAPTLEAEFNEYWTKVDAGSKTPWPRNEMDPVHEGGAAGPIPKTPEKGLISRTQWLEAYTDAFGSRKLYAEARKIYVIPPAIGARAVSLDSLWRIRKFMMKLCSGDNGCAADWHPPAWKPMSLVTNEAEFKQHIGMVAVNKFFVYPLCYASGASVAEVLHGSASDVPPRPTHFISHNWGSNFWYFVESALEHCKGQNGGTPCINSNDGTNNQKAKDTFYWVCTFCNPQYSIAADGTRQKFSFPPYAPEAGDTRMSVAEKSAFAVAIKNVFENDGGTVLSIQDTTKTDGKMERLTPGRIWCYFETAYAGYHLWEKHKTQKPNPVASGELYTDAETATPNKAFWNAAKINDRIKVAFDVPGASQVTFNPQCANSYCPRAELRKIKFCPVSNTGTSADGSADKTYRVSSLLYYPGSTSDQDRAHILGAMVVFAKDILGKPDQEMPLQDVVVLFDELQKHVFQSYEGEADVEYKRYVASQTQAQQQVLTKDQMQEAFKGHSKATATKQLHEVAQAYAGNPYNKPADGVKLVEGFLQLPSKEGELMSGKCIVDICHRMADIQVPAGYGGHPKSAAAINKDEYEKVQGVCQADCSQVVCQVLDTPLMVILAEELGFSMHH